jgi:hypothetical protein
MAFHIFLRTCVTLTVTTTTTTTTTAAASTAGAAVLISVLPLIVHCYMVTFYLEI